MPIVGIPDQHRSLAISETELTRSNGSCPSSILYTATDQIVSSILPTHRRATAGLTDLRVSNVVCTGESRGTMSITGRSFEGS